MFADNTAVVSTGSTWKDAYMNVSYDLSLIKHWFDHNSLTVNITKTKYMPIVSKNIIDPGVLQLRTHSCGDPYSILDCVRL